MPTKPEVAIVLAESPCMRLVLRHRPDRHCPELCCSRRTKKKFYKAMQTLHVTLIEEEGVVSSKRPTYCHLHTENDPKFLRKE